MNIDIRSLLADRRADTYELHKKYINPQLTRVFKVIGFDRNYVEAKGPWLIDAKGARVLDFLAGFGVFNIGRNHHAVAKALRDVLDAETASMVQMDASLPAGLLAEALVRIAPPGLDSVFFTTSGTESVEGALKFARQATGRHKLVYCDHAFHGLTMGSLSVNGAPEFRERNEPLLPGCDMVPFNDLDALERALSGKDVAAFIFEPVQGKGVFAADPGYLAGARELCTRYGTLLIADEVQTGFGRTGRMFAVDHWGVAPDIMTVSKALSGGYVPVGAILSRSEITARVFDSMERCYAHSNTFGRGDMAMVAGLATLAVLKQEKLAENAQAMGDYLMNGLRELADRYEMLTEIRGLGLMIGIQFGKPKSLALKTGWNLLHKINPDLFCQMITIPLLEKHNILTQVAGHGLDTVKILPPLVIGKEEADLFLEAMDDVLGEAHRFPGSAWTTTKNLAIRTAANS